VDPRLSKGPAGPAGKDAVGGEGEEGFGHLGPELGGHPSPRRSRQPGVRMGSVLQDGKSAGHFLPSAAMENAAARMYHLARLTPGRVTPSAAWEKFCRTV